VLPDRTASIRLPAGWSVVQTGIAFIHAKGPNGELAIFGIVVPAQDTPSSAVTASGVHQAYSADIKDKFTQSMAWVFERLGKGNVPINILTDKQFNAPSQFGTCANFTMLLGQQGGFAAEADFCSLPKDNGGSYKNFFKIVGLRSANAKQERAMLEAILGSYWLNFPAIKQQLANGAQGRPGASPGAPMQRPPALQGQAAALVNVQQQQMAWQLAQAQINAIQSSTNYAMRSSLQSASDFDHSILRGDTAVYGSGSSQPLFWISN
jgi:hypothetical protein